MNKNEICKVYHNDVNYEIALDMLNNMPEEKKAVLRKALTRNFILTSSYVLESGTMSIYHEGFLLKLSGCQSSFSVFAFDRDGEFEFARKPHESKLHKIYDDLDLEFSESDFKEF